MSEPDELGARALKLLDKEWMVAVLRGLADGAQRPAELEEQLAQAGHAAVMRRLRHLLEHGLVSYEYLPGRPSRTGGAGIPHEAHYHLTDAVPALLEIVAQADRWERTWCSQDERRDPHGTLAIELAADHHTRKIALLLADGPLSIQELDRRTPDLARSPLRRRLRELVLAGLLERVARGRARWYGLTDGARHLALVAMLAGRWEWRWSRPEHPAPGRDLDGLVHLLAPVAEVPTATAGICRLRLDTGGADDRDIYLAAHAGRLLASADVPAGAPAAAGHASPRAWCEALLGNRESPIAISGDHTLLAAVIQALSAALLA